MSEGKCGIGIETVEEHQGKGFATAVAAEFVRHALALGFKPHWDCWANNLPSIRVAEKVGFEDAHDYKGAIGGFGKQSEEISGAEKNSGQQRHPGCSNALQ
jgi:RimJ/RimL family protein N-acetyltransferase